MFERFTDRARKVMALANQEAQRLNHKDIGSGHILLGLAKEGSGVATTVLKLLGVDLLKLRSELQKKIKPGPDVVITRGKLPQTPAAKKVIEYTIKEARRLGHNYVGTEHILLGLLRRQKTLDGKYRRTTAQRILWSLGIRLKKAREEVEKTLGVGKKETVLELSSLRDTKEIALRIAKAKSTMARKKQRPVKCKIFKSDEGEITEFLKTKEFVQATQSSSTRITIFYRDRE